MPDLAAGLDAVTPEVSQHIQGCAGCAEKLTEFRQTMALLDEWQAPEPSPYFDVRLRARLREEAARLGFVTATEFDRLVQPEKMVRPR